MAIRINGQEPGDLGPPFRKRQVRHNSAQGFKEGAPYDSRTGNDSPLWPTVDIKIGVVEEPIEPETSGVITVWRNPRRGDEPEATSDRIRVYYDWAVEGTLQAGTEVIAIEFPDEELWRVFKAGGSSSIKLQRCSDSKTVHAVNVLLSEELGRLSDQVGKIIRVRESALLAEDCWTIIGETDCYPEICPSVCMIYETCPECFGCFKLTRCTDGTVIITQSTELCDRPADGFAFEVALATGGVVRLDDGYCYTVEVAPSCLNSTPVNVIGLAANCAACLLCFELTPCFGEGPPVYIYQDDHDLSVGDVIKYNGICMEVTGEECNGTPSSFSTPYTREESCETCACYSFTACSNLFDSITVRSAITADGDILDLESIVGKVAMTNAGDCFQVDRTTDSCEGGVDIVILETWDSGDCNDCGVTELEGCGVPDIVTYSDMSRFAEGYVIRRAEDGYCYIVGAFINNSPTVGELVTVEEWWEKDPGLEDPCDRCEVPCYSLTPNCKSCDELAPNHPECENEGGTPVAGGGVQQFTTDDLSDVVGQYIKIDGICYYVGTAEEADCVGPTTGITYDGPFPNCEECQITCLWVVTNVYEEDNKLKQDRKKILVDVICEEATTDIIGIEDCPP
jgi:hypothetical protein